MYVCVCGVCVLCVYVCDVCMFVYVWCVCVYVDGVCVCMYVCMWCVYVFVCVCRVVCVCVLETCSKKDRTF